MLPNCNEWKNTLSLIGVNMTDAEPEHTIAEGKAHPLSSPSGEEDHASANGHDFEAMWKAREDKILQSVSRVADVNYNTAMKYKIWHLTCSVIVMICAVLAPLFIASASTLGTASGTLGISAVASSRISLGLTVTLGVVEGLRRIFRFEQRWFAYYTACNGLVQTMERYLDVALDLKPGSPKWKELFFAFHKDVQGIFNEQNKSFFQGVLDQSDLSPGPNRRSGRQR